MTRPGIERRSPGPLANTLPNRPMNRYRNCDTYIYIYIYIYIYRRTKTERKKERNEEIDV